MKNTAWSTMNLITGDQIGIASSLFPGKLKNRYAWIDTMTTQPIPDQPVCNLTNALARLGSSRELLYEMIDIYLEDYGMILQRITSAAESGAPTELKRGAHSIKGLAATFDAVQVIEAANAVTQASQAGFGRAPWDQIANLEKAAERLAEHLRAACKGKTADSNSD